MLKHPVARRLLAVSVVSTLGDWLASGAIFVIAYERAGDLVLGTGLAYAVQAIPGILVGTLGFSLLDRFDRKATLVVAHLLGAASLGLIALPGLAPVLVAAACLGGLRTVITSVRTAASAAAVPREIHGPLLALLNTVGNGAQVIGLGLGVSLTTLIGPAPPLIYDAGSFVIAALILASTDIPPRTTLPGPDDSSGLSVIVSDPVLRGLLLLLVFTLPLAAIPETLAAALTLDGIERGLLVAVAPAATVIMNLLLGPRDVLVRKSSTHLILIVVGIFGATAASLVITSISAVIACNAIIGVSVGWALGAQVVFMDRVPADDLARVTGVVVALIIAGEGLGSVVIGAVSDRYGPAAGYGFAAGSGVVGIVVHRLATRGADRDAEREAGVLR